MESILKDESARQVVKEELLRIKYIFDNIFEYKCYGLEYHSEVTRKTENGLTITFSYSKNNKIIKEFKLFITFPINFTRYYRTHYEEKSFYIRHEKERKKYLYCEKDSIDLFLVYDLYINELKHILLTNIPEKIKMRAFLEHFCSLFHSNGYLSSYEQLTRKEITFRYVISHKYIYLFKLLFDHQVGFTINKYKPISFLMDHSDEPYKHEHKKPISLSTNDILICSKEQRKKIDQFRLNMGRNGIY